MSAGPLPIDRETAIEIIVSTLSVVGFIIGTLAIGVTYGDDGLGEAGALALVALIVLFILLMTAVGYWLSARDP